MKKILLTGSTGFIGMNIAPLLRMRYDVVSPGRSELDLLDGDKLQRYLDVERFDAVVHLANPTSQNPLDPLEELFERSLRVFTSLERCAGMYGKLIYLGSGAEYGKHRALSQIEESAFGEELPRDPYGLSRYIMNKLAGAHDNIINLRLFGCYGAGDPPYKLMPHIIRCIREGQALTLKQDVWFDFLYVEDIFPVLAYFIENSSNYRAYNLCSGRRVLISSIALEILGQMSSELPIEFQKNGLGLEYTGSNLRLRSELPDWKPHSISEGIRKLLEHEQR